MHPSHLGPQTGHLSQFVKEYLDWCLKLGHGQGSTAKGQSGPCASFSSPPTPCLGSLLWKANLSGFFVYSEVPQTSSSISEPVTSNCCELEVFSLMGSPSQSSSSLITGRPCLKPVPPVKTRFTTPRSRGAGCISEELTIT